MRDKTALSRRESILVAGKTTLRRYLGSTSAGPDPLSPPHQHLKKITRSVGRWGCSQWGRMALVYPWPAADGSVPVAC